MSNKATNAFANGDTVFSIHGEEAVWLAQAAQGHVVQPVYESEDGEPYYGQPVTWVDVFAKPPVAKLEAQVAELSKKLDDLRQQARMAEIAAHAQKKELGVIEDRYKQFPQLRDLDLWLSGACTHIVILGSYSFEVKELKDALEYKDSYTPSLRLLALYCDPRKERDWSLRMSQHSDGSGSSNIVLLATSLEDATAKAEEWFNGQLLRCRKGSGYEHYAIGLSRCAIKHGFNVPDELKQKIAEADAKAVSDRLANARRDFERAKQNLEALEAAQ